MAQRRTPIQVPPRTDDEAPASAEQLQFIRQLVTGMSLQGFRFDYRKMGSDQAASVIDQLLEMRDASEVPRPGKQAGGGCVGAVMRAFARGVTTLIVAAVVLAGVAGGGYLIWQKINEEPGTNTSAQADADSASTADGGSSDPNHKESKIFEGLYVEDDAPPDDPGDTGNRDHADRNPTDRPETGTPDTTPTTDPTPPTDPAVAEQLDDLRLMLAQLKQFTRKDYDASIRGQSSAAMLRRLEQLPAVMKQLDPAVAERIKQVVAGYSAAELDGQAMRAELDALLDVLKAWNGS